jgi:hypothetical protein
MLAIGHQEGSDDDCPLALCAESFHKIMEVRGAQFDHLPNMLRIKEKRNLVKMSG